ncbi:type II toxin-antitoxin system RelE/ParE family toxin [Siccibacter colletis]|uniref:type II toxin-antitoxin system RelE/ParE family toxin n=1 Tax=Siccibacter colletis TaxID=1505757 RepID=UPI0028BD271A|nr:type II toxin-antitoxin system RelE/ParE family toxin [Siccibacter colletis]WNN48599.1 type II toxin-antitoxin system RelE/ParE family toxin [Siccibacter colletis]
MLFIETDIFTAGVKSLLSDEAYQRLQLFLVVKPDRGDVIPDTGGLRKVRWLAQGCGKRGGVRVIYFYRYAENEIRLLLIYRKGIKDDLSSQEKAVLRRLNERW